MPSAIRLTKIVATLGPATASEQAVRAIIEAGCNVVRLNASHGRHDELAEFLRLVRTVAADLGRHVAVLLDLCGPKIRVAAITAEPLELETDQTVTITATDAPTDGPGFSTTYPAIVDDCRSGQRILLDDGAIALRIEERSHDGRLICRVTDGGTLWRAKGINLPDTDVSSPALTEKDLADLAWGCQGDVDYIGLSFVRRPEDVRELRRRIAEAGGDARVVAKIEKPEAVEAIEEIIANSDAVMVARGDLGVEMDVEHVPLVQKRITRLAIEAGKPVIVATQMLQSMIDAPQPTRAEVSDVANSILDGTDAVMLSGETAVGRYPQRAVAMMDRICNLTEDHEKELVTWSAGRRVRPVSRAGESPAAPGAACPLEQDLALADGAVVIARDTHAEAIVVLTHSGATALAVSKRRPDVPVIAVSDREDTCRRMALYRGVLAVHHPELIRAEDLRGRVSRLVGERKWIEDGSPVVIISGQFPGKPGTSDMLQICRLSS